MAKKNIFRRKRKQKFKMPKFKGEKPTQTEAFGYIYKESERMHNPTMITLISIIIFSLVAIFISWSSSSNLILIGLFLVIINWMGIPISVMGPYYFSRIFYPNKNLPKFYKKIIPICWLMLISWLIFFSYVYPNLNLGI